MSQSLLKVSSVCSVRGSHWKRFLDSETRDKQAQESLGFLKSFYTGDLEHFKHFLMEYCAYIY